jgi:hypothetical protein
MQNLIRESCRQKDESMNCNAAAPITRQHGKEDIGREETGPLSLNRVLRAPSGLVAANIQRVTHEDPAFPGVEKKSTYCQG